MEEYKNKSQATIIVLMMIIVALISGGVVYFWKQNEIDRLRQIVPPIVTLPTNSPLVTYPTTNPTPIVQETPSSTLSSLDAEWNMYTNNVFGFSIKVPKIAEEFSGICANGKLDSGAVAVRTIDDNTGTYLTFDYFYEYPVNNKCEKKTTSLPLLEERVNQWKKGNGNQLNVPKNWHIITATVKNDSELEQFIKTTYGNACSLGEKKLTTGGLYSVQVKGDGLDPEVSKCWLNYAMAFKYSPELKKAATWAMGQDVSFGAKNYTKTYDEEMVNSFRFF